ncbi:MAG TPA: hypothetical protein VKT77_10790, partial [Chthonomonadaceae bacterium]|nr:hypothetical protein [Chthonomonadaceae bacterium]
MQIRLTRTAAVPAFGVLFALSAALPALAQPTPHENSLLGITLLRSSYRDVLHKFGRPDEIQAGGPFVPGASSGKGTNSTGFPGRGGTGAASPGGPGMGGMAGGPMAGYPGGSGAGLPGFAGSSGAMAAKGSNSPMGDPMGGAGQNMAGMSNSGGAGNSGGGGGASEAPAAPEYEATWWYHDKKNGIHKSFLFNKDGRVIQVQEYGFDPAHKSGKTHRGIGLGSSFNQVLHTYGWSMDGLNDGRNMIMRFGGEDKVAFQLVDNRVLGITIAVVKEV